jgi:hypothetical protein
VLPRNGAGEHLFWLFRTVLKEIREACRIGAVAFVAGVRPPQGAASFPQGDTVTVTYTFDIFSTLDGFANHNGDWGGYWGKQGPELLAHRAAAYRDPLRMVLGAKTYSSNAPFLTADFDRSLFDARTFDGADLSADPTRLIGDA